MTVSASDMSFTVHWNSIRLDRTSRPPEGGRVMVRIARRQGFDSNLRGPNY
jgi:hypothetical protein